MINLSELLDRAKKKALEKPDNKDGYAPKSTDELRFKRKHVHVTEPDANKNGDDVFKGTNVKAVDRQPHYGYNPGQDEEFYEEVKKKICKECGKKYTGKQCSCCMNEESRMDEAAYSATAARAGKDIGERGKNFKEIAASAAKRYGSEESGEKVAGAILAKIRAKHLKNSYEPENETSLDEMQWYKGRETAVRNPHPDHELNDLSDKELKNIVDNHNKMNPEKDYDPTGNRSERKIPKNVNIAKDLLFYRQLSKLGVNESAPPGKEKMVLALKKKFGKNSSAPFAIAWSKYNAKKGK